MKDKAKKQDEVRRPPKYFMDAFLKLRPGAFKTNVALLEAQQPLHERRHLGLVCGCNDRRLDSPYAVGVLREHVHCRSGGERD